MFRAILLAAVMAVAACTTSPETGRKQFDIQKFAQSAQLALTGLESAATIYTSGGVIPAEQKQKIVDAEKAAEALIASIPTVKPEDARAIVSKVIESLNAVMAALPPTAVPASVRGYVLMAEVLAQTATTLATQ